LELNRRDAARSAEADFSSSFRDDLRESVEVDVDVDRQLEHEENVLHLLPGFSVDVERLSFRRFDDKVVFF
jgi:hypothetical protein